MIPAETSTIGSGSTEQPFRDSLRPSHYVIDSKENPDPGQPRRPAKAGNPYCVPGFPYCCIVEPNKRVLIDTKLHHCCCRCKLETRGK